MRLSAAVAVAAAVQNRLIRRDKTLNLRVMGRQPHPNPDYVAYTRSAAQPAWRWPTTPRPGAMRKRVGLAWGPLLTEEEFRSL